eukprot:TRINITY_DN39470_c0_g1_i2.p1 TRINITY_DN39470_c0_g1~~TRINITY_DN39470_c0_g1_i2.p1  ORF type:complete len:272 (+),score=93.07 TRINITY_DN39470_c0_g1_i2:53-868(+)
MCIRDRYQRRVRGTTNFAMPQLSLVVLCTLLVATHQVPDQTAASGGVVGADDPVTMLTSSSSASPPPGIMIDIHLPITTGPAADAAIAANKFLVDRNVSEINLSTIDKPHATLYLTEWQCENGTQSACIAEIKAAVAKTVTGFAPCNFSLGEPFAQGTYAMISVNVTACLQKYSDTMVLATYKFAAKNQTPPPWIHNLPEPERSEKLAMVAKYGSPNVFSQFQPHVSIGWSENMTTLAAVSYTHLRAHETPEHLVCRLLLEKKKKKNLQKN